MDLLAESVSRYGIMVHAYVLMDNHYHLLIETPRANASRAMQWLNLSYSVWHNVRHQRSGALFRARFKSIPVDREGSWSLAASVYLHLWGPSGSYMYIRHCHCMTQSRLVGFGYATIDQAEC